jgi:hypothetical protein
MSHRCHGRSPTACTLARCVRARGDSAVGRALFRGRAFRETLACRKAFRRLKAVAATAATEPRLHALRPNAARAATELGREPALEHRHLALAADLWNEPNPPSNQDLHQPANCCATRDFGGLSPNVARRARGGAPLNNRGDTSPSS